MDVNTQFDIAVIGGGAVGLSAAYKLSDRYPDTKILVLEKEASVAQHQTGRNSGVIHSGIYYKPGSYKARLCVAGRDEIVAFAQVHNVAHEVCGKIIVAVSEDELPGLDKIFSHGKQNGLENIRKIGADDIRAIEPHCTGIAAIHVPYTGIIDYVGVCKRLADLITTRKPNQVLVGHSVTAIHNNAGVYRISTNRGTFAARYLISCAGLQSDRLARMEGLRPAARIVGFRGDYYELSPAARHKVQHLIYPVPNPNFPFLGVHFTRMVPSEVHPQGGVECGPNAVFTFKREGYNKTDFDLRDSADALTFSGTWRLFAKHWQHGLDEYRRAFSKPRFLKTLQRLIPSLTIADITPGRAGVRAMALQPDGAMVDDFAFAETERSIHVLNAPSPAATACLAIGSELRDRAIQNFSL